MGYSFDRPMKRHGQWGLARERGGHPHSGQADSPQESGKVAPGIGLTRGGPQCYVHRLREICSSTFMAACAWIKATGQFVFGGLMGAQIMGIHAPERKGLFAGLILAF